MRTWRAVRGHRVRRLPLAQADHPIGDIIPRIPQAARHMRRRRGSMSNYVTAIGLDVHAC